MTTMPILGHDTGLSHYLSEIRKFPMLSKKDEFSLAEQWKNNGDRQAAHTLVTSHLRLVAKIAMNYRGYGLPVSDLIAEGNIGMMQAVKKFDPAKGFRLATYAMWWIKASIQEFILNSWSLVKIGTTAGQKKLFFNLKKLKNRMKAYDRHDLTPSQADAIASTLNLKVDEVYEMNGRLSTGDQSLNTPVYEEGASTQWQDTIASNVPSQETVLIASDYKTKQLRRIHKAMDTLSDREKAIFTKRRLTDPAVTLEALSTEYGISRERVRQLEVKAFETVQRLAI